MIQPKMDILEVIKKEKKKEKVPETQYKNLDGYVSKIFLVLAIGVILLPVFIPSINPTQYNQFLLANSKYLVNGGLATLG